MNSVKADEAQAVLRDVIEGVVSVACISKGSSQHRFRTSHGWEFEIFDDAGEMDYLDSIEAPDGRKGDFDDYYGAHRDPINEVDVEALARALDWCAHTDYRCQYAYGRQSR